MGSQLIPSSLATMFLLVWKDSKNLKIAWVPALLKKKKQAEGFLFFFLTNNGHKRM